MDAATSSRTLWDAAQVWHMPNVEIVQQMRLGFSKVPENATGLTFQGACKDFWGAPLQTQQERAAKMWNAARASVGLGTMSAQAVWALPYFHLRAEVNTCADGSLSYKDVWKAANNFFQHNLEQKCDARRGGVSPASSAGHRPFLFSYIRDPRARFVSAYREVTFRIYKSHCVHEFEANDWRSKQKVGVGQIVCGDFDPANHRLEALAKGFLTALLDGHRFYGQCDAAALAPMPCHLSHSLGLVARWPR